MQPDSSSQSDPNLTHEFYIYSQLMSPLGVNCEDANRSKPKQDHGEPIHVSDPNMMLNLCILYQDPSLT